MSGENEGGGPSEKDLAGITPKKIREGIKNAEDWANHSKDPKGITRKKAKPFTKSDIDEAIVGLEKSYLMPAAEPPHFQEAFPFDFKKAKIEAEKEKKELLKKAEIEEKLLEDRGNKDNGDEEKATPVKKKSRRVRKVAPPRSRQKPSKEIAENHPLKTTDKELNLSSLDFPQTEMQTVEAILKFGTSPEEITENLKNDPEAGFSSLVNILNARIQDIDNIFSGLSPYDAVTRAKVEDMKTILNLAKEAAELTTAGESLYPDFDPEEPYEDIRDSALKYYLDGEIARQKKLVKDLPEDQVEPSKLFAAYFSTLRKQFADKVKIQKSDLHQL